MKGVAGSFFLFSMPKLLALAESSFLTESHLGQLSASN
jgi:hypothetical protein